MRDGIYRHLTQLELTNLGQLCLNSRFTVEGQLQGAHPSPLKGFSVEFADYRQYVAGDDLRHLDWRVFGRSERLYVRQYEEECNLRLYLLLDGSRSMAYGSGGSSKYRFAARLAAALAYVTIQQQDSVGLHLCARDLLQQFPARSGSGHLRTLANCLAEHEPAGDTDLAGNLHRLAESIQRRALIVVISDFYDEPEALRQALAHLKKRRHDLIAYQVLDRAELDFPFRELGNFQDLETGDTLITNPRVVRPAYLQLFANFLHQLKTTCSGLDVDYNLAISDQALPPFIRQHLNRRQGKR